MKRYFITGATGVVGSALCRRLLAERDTNLYLLIRGKTDADVAQRLDALFAFWGIDNAQTRSRVIALRGDAAVPQFGLDPDDYRTLVQTSTHIVHSAGAVRMNLSIEAARHSALDSANAIITLARECRAHGRNVKTEFLSTVGVGGKSAEPLPERWIEHDREFHNTYEQAKAEAEVIAKHAIDEGLALTVHRPSMVVGDSKTGDVVHFQVFYHLAEFLSGKRTFGFSPDTGGATLDLIPSDYVASAIQWASDTPSTAGRILHLCSGPRGAISLTALRPMVRAAFEAHGVPIPRSRVVSQRTFRRAISVLTQLSSGRNKRVLATLPVFLDYLADTQSFSNTLSARLLNDIGIALPRAETYVPVILNRYLKQRKG